MDRLRTEEPDPYLAAFRGGFVGVLRWAQMSDLWARIAADTTDGWYIYAIGETPPTEPSDGEAVNRFLHEMDGLLRRDHDEDYCGIVYADDLHHPAFVKIYDPHNLGVVCGSSDTPPLPGWTLSKLPPVDLPGAVRPVAARQRWWRKAFARRT